MKLEMVDTPTEEKIEMDQEEVKPTGASRQTEIAERGFTPGPWAQSSLAAGYVISLADDHEVVCSFVEYNKDGTVELEFKNAVNNMALAIAAPALYEALKELLNYGVEFDDARLSYVSAQIDRQAIADARAALALVDGPQNQETK